MTKLDRLGLMAALLCAANEASKRGSGVSDHDLKVAADQAFLLNARIEERLARQEAASTAAAQEGDQAEPSSTQDP